jgi:lipopolysaccharide transport system ATP-binding protein
MIGTPAMIVIEAQDVGYFFQKRKGFFQKEKYWALQQVSFSLNKGESLGIIGRNGAGKSTLLRLLAGIIIPDRGKLINHGYSVSLLSLQAGFIQYLTGRENAILNGLILGFEKQEILDMMEEIHEFSGLGFFFDQPINSYSSGMKARLGFSIAFQLAPDILLIDEVLGVGDEAFRRKSSKKMKEKIRSNSTTVLVSHTPGTIKELCDRALWIEDGVTRASGSPDEVLLEYSDHLKNNENIYKENIRLRKQKLKAQRGVSISI